MIYTIEQIREADRKALRHQTEESLIWEAGTRLSLHIKPFLKRENRIVVVAGRGNNGGDGAVVAECLRAEGWKVSLWFPLGQPEWLHTRFGQKLKSCVLNREPETCDIVIDALFGIGVTKKLGSDVLYAIEWMNRQALRFSIDVPSGVPADHLHGWDGVGVRADETFCVHAYKRSAFLPESAPYYGRVHLVDIGLPADDAWRTVDRSDWNPSLLERETFGHKGRYGHGLLIGGSRHFLGAPLLAAKASLRSGIGLLDVATVPEVRQHASYVPEAMYYDLSELPTRSYAAVAVGPGMTATQYERIKEILPRYEAPLILDAGALQRTSLPPSRFPILVTPHPGELARMSGSTIESIERDRFRAASRFASAHGVHVLLKGTYTIICDPNGEGVVNIEPAAALAKGGSGDVLTGILLAFWAKSAELTPLERSAQAVLLHVLSAQRALKSYQAGSVLASDVIDAIGRR